MTDDEHDAAQHRDVAFGDVEFSVSKLDGGGTDQPNRLLGGWRLARAGALLALTGVIVLAGLVTGARLGWWRQGTPAQPMPRVFSLVRAALPCMEDAAWSRDSQHVAFVGYDRDCAFLTPDPRADNPPPISGALVILDVVAGRFVTMAHPDAAIRARLGANVAPAAIVLYQHVLWSPDGQRVAVTFRLLAGPARPTVALMVGVATFSLTGALLQFGTHAPVDAAIWDLRTGAVVATAADVSQFPFPQNLPAAPLYGWGAAGAFGPFTPQADVTTAPNETGPTGSTDGEQVFSRWQPGAIAYIAPLDLWSATYEAWSPDGRYLEDGGATGGAIASDNLTMAGRDALALVGNVTVPMRDAALRAAFTLLHARAPTQSASIAWRPDNATLAVYDTSLLTVHLFSVAAGRHTGQLNVPNTHEVTTGADRLLLWSPNGHYLLLTGAQVGAALVWTP